MPDPFGFTRNIVRQRYALLTPSGFVPSYLPGWQKAVCHVLISPAMGARFSQLFITLESDGQCMGNTGSNQYFIYLVEGTASILLDERRHRLEAGSYVYLSAGMDVQLKSGGPATRVLIFQKPYEPLPGTMKPVAFVGHERDIKGQPFLGNEDARVAVERLLDQAKADVQNLIDSNRHLVVALRDELLAREELVGDEIVEVLREAEARNRLGAQVLPERA